MMNLITKHVFLAVLLTVLEVPSVYAAFTESVELIPGGATIADTTSVAFSSSAITFGGSASGIVSGGSLVGATEGLAIAATFSVVGSSITDGSFTFLDSSGELYLSGSFREFTLISGLFEVLFTVNGGSAAAEFKPKLIITLASPSFTSSTLASLASQTGVSRFPAALTVSAVRSVSTPASIPRPIPVSTVFQGTIAKDEKVENITIGTRTSVHPEAIMGQGVIFVSDSNIPSGLNLAGILDDTQGEAGVFKLDHAIVQNSKTLLEELKSQLDDFFGIKLHQNAGNNVLEFIYNSEVFILAATEVIYTGNEAVPSIALNEEGDFEIITLSGYQITLSTIVNDTELFKTLLEEYGLGIESNGAGAIKVSNIQQEKIFSNYFSAKAEPTLQATTKEEGFFSEAHKTLPKLNVYYLVSGNNDEQRQKQYLRPYPANWTALKEWLQDDFQNVAIDLQNIITAETDTMVYRGIVSYLVTPAGASLTDKVELTPTGDLNNDGLDDFLITYPNGDQQQLYIYSIKGSGNI